MLKPTRPWRANRETKKAFVGKEITRRCDACQKLAEGPFRFGVDLPTEERLVFGDEVSIGIMFLEKDAVHHIVDTATRLSAAAFLDQKWATNTQTIEGIWLAFATTWSLV